MKEEIEKVLGMLEEGKISREDAVKLIEAMKSGEEGEKVMETGVKAKKKFHVVISKEGKREVEVNVPFGVAKMALLLAKKLGKNTINFNGNEIPIDSEKVESILNDPEFRGKLVDIEDGESGEHVVVEIV